MEEREERGQGTWSPDNKNQTWTVLDERVSRRMREGGYAAFHVLP
jgi:hypothetical protein